MSRYLHSTQQANHQDHWQFGCRDVRGVLSTTTMTTSRSTNSTLSSREGPRLVSSAQQLNSPYLLVRCSKLTSLTVHPGAPPYQKTVSHQSLRWSDCQPMLPSHSASLPLPRLSGLPRLCSPAMPARPVLALEQSCSLRWGDWRPLRTSITYQCSDVEWHFNCNLSNGSLTQTEDGWSRPNDDARAIIRSRTPTLQQTFP